MTALLIAIALLEAGTGLALIAIPSLLAALLLGAPLGTPVELVLARLAGAALLSLGLACWLARCDEQSGARRVVIKSMLLYNVGAAVVLVYARFGLGLSGILLLPAAILHFALAVWCIAWIRG